MTQAPIQVRGLWKSYDIHPAYSVWTKARRLWARVRGLPPAEPFWALRDVTFEVAKGEVLGIIGPNGAGKTTILKALCGVTAPTRGEINVNGRVAPLIELGAGFHPDLSGRENVLINGVMLGMSIREVKRKYDTIVEFSGLKEFMDTPVKKYSSGMFVRLGFAVAIHTEPDVLLIDEVLAVGDHTFRGRCMERMKALQGRGVSTILVSHNMLQISNLCERVLWLDSGRARVLGKPSAVVQTYLNTRDMSVRGTKGTEVVEGTGEIVIISVRLLDANGKETQRCSTQQPLHFEMTYEAKKQVREPNFGIGIFAADGLRLGNITTNAANCSPRLVSGKGTVRCFIDPHGLMPGDYYLLVAIKDPIDLLAYHRIEHALDFHIEDPKAEAAAYGLTGHFRFPARWQFTS